MLRPRDPGLLTKLLSLVLALSGITSVGPRVGLTAVPCVARCLASSLAPQPVAVATSGRVREFLQEMTGTGGSGKVR